MTRALSQRRAEAALQVVDSREAQACMGELRSRLMSLPAMLLTQGLAGCLAFVASKAVQDGNRGSAYDITGQAMATWLGKYARSFAIEDLDNGRLVDFVGRLGTLDPVVYGALTDEAIRYAGWLRRMIEARALAPDGDQEGHE